MSIGSVGSVSFWQQDQNYWNQAQAASQSSASSDALITAIGNLQTTKVRGLASIANHQALDRVNAQLTAALQSAVQASQAGSTSSGSTASTNGAPATGTGTVPLTANTSLITLGIPANSVFTVSDGTNTNSYSSTGTDTVADLVNGLNKTGPTAANVAVWLNGSGKLVVTGTNDTVSASVGGIFASNIGFGSKNDTFQPTAPTPSSSSGSSTASASSTSGTSSSNGSSASTAPPTLFNSSYALQTSGTAETLLASSGALLNQLA